MANIDISNPNVDQYTPGFPGDLADIGLKDSISRQNTGDAPIPFAAAVEDGPMSGTTTGGCQKFSGGRVIGFAKADFALRPVAAAFGTNDAQPPLEYLPGDTVHIVRDARMRQIATADVHRGDPVAVDADGVVGAGTAVPGCTWETDTKAGELGIIQILIVASAAGGSAPEGYVAKKAQPHE
jgi:hypothetical protein